MQQVLWPDHCVHGTPGWDFHPGLDRSLTNATFCKGQDKRVDSYSGFYDNGKYADDWLRAAHPFLGKSTGLADYIREQAQDRGANTLCVDIVGLALGYCVTYTALDARLEHFAGKPFQVRVIEDGVRNISLQDGDYERQISQLKKAGIETICSDMLL